MSRLGDKLRAVADEIDAWAGLEPLIAVSAIVTESYTFRAMTDKPKDEDEALAFMGRSIALMVDVSGQNQGEQLEMRSKFVDAPGP